MKNNVYDEWEKERKKIIERNKQIENLTSLFVSEIVKLGITNREYQLLKAKLEEKILNSKINL